MPELPSIEIYKKYFNKTSLDKEIKDLDVLSPEILRNQSPQEIRNCLIGHRFINSKRYGKFLFAEISNGMHLVLHFGMTGYLVYYQDKGPSHIRMLISFKEGFLAFDDMRKFGRISLTPNPDLYIQENNIGPDALEISLKSFLNIFRNRRGAIKPLLMNQHIIAGLGNLYVDETLYQSGLHPLTPAYELKKSDWENLYYKMKKVLYIAIEYGDKPHKMPSNFLLSHRYPGAKCSQGEEIKIIKVGGRTTYLCPKSQILRQ